jgi:hypothetical protein
MALCPAHPDKNPSLSLRERNGKILVKCQAGCSTDSVLNALGLEWKDLLAATTSTAQSKSCPNPHIVAEYSYVDEVGKLLFQVLRKDPKGFMLPST